ncbi:MAG: outer membrane lipoprotein carrier protein LolA [Syntrophorhabdaceae bacterium]|nr:outer membrane lipoprotein carrier protein LolA [Syntrophorhabdaceae bacterium]
MRHGIRVFLLLSALLSAAAVVVLSLPIAIAGENPPDGDAILRKIGKRYAAVGTLSARFRQDVPLQNLGIVRKASGKVYLGRPMKMRWDYDAPENQLFLADGEYFYFRPAGSFEVIRRKIDEKSIGGRIPLLLLFGKGDISSMFNVRETISAKDGSGVILRLVPKDDGAPEIRMIDLLVDKRDNLIKEVHLYDRLGGENHLYLSDIQFDSVLPSDIFRFKNPSGTPVVDG